MYFASSSIAESGPPFSRIPEQSQAYRSGSHHHELAMRIPHYAVMGPVCHFPCLMYPTGCVPDCLLSSPVAHFLACLFLHAGIYLSICLEFLILVKYCSIIFFFETAGRSVYFDPEVTRIDPILGGSSVFGVLTGALDHIHMRFPHTVRHAREKSNF